MAYDEKLAERIRQRFRGLNKVEEKQMMGGLTFMYNNKMCMGIIKDELMCRISPELHDEAITRKGCRTMDFTNRPMKGYIMIATEGMKSDKDFNHWMDMALAYNQQAKPSRKRKPI